ncbi:unnamed protein product [Amaranthus hypochondriacus]
MFSFVSKNDVAVALDEKSIFWKMFDNVRQWSEGERFDERLVWLECFGIHPKCYSLENVKKLGEKWGSVLFIDQFKDGCKCLTYARLLVRTQAQNRVDAHVRFLFENGSCEVWVKESSGYSGNSYGNHSFNDEGCEKFEKMNGCNYSKILQVIESLEVREDLRNDEVMGKPSNQDVD